MKEKIVNLLGVFPNRVVLSRFKGNKGKKMLIVMEPINEDDEKRIDNSINYYNELRYENKNKTIIKGSNILLYGEVNIEDKNDLDIISKLKLIFHEEECNVIYTNFNYDKGIYSTIDGIVKTCFTNNPIDWFKYKYCLLGKPTRVIVYKTPA